MDKYLWQPNKERIQKSILEDDNTVDNQIINHGAGGCTPNVATGGCLD